MSDYTHVVESRKHLLELDMTQRMAICGDDFWIPMERYDKYFKIINKILTRQNQHQAQCILFTARPGGGKTAFVNQIMEVYQFKPEKIMKIQMEENIDKFRLKELILDAFDIRTGPRAGRASRTAMLRRAISEGNYKALLADETHDALNEAERTLLQNMSLLKHMCGGVYKMALLAFGNGAASEVIRSDDQTGRRFVHYVLPGWGLDDEFREFVWSYVSHLPLQLPSKDVLKDEFLAKLYKASWGVMDNFVKILKAAAEIGIESGDECITIEHIDNYKDICNQCGYAIVKPTPDKKRPRREKL
ncbi:TniB family NTP-binding protein [Pseudomonas sp. CVAP|uniref:TniB family NTP-binding protein n=1 Tax=Pseudomonas sp. CVAP\|nr:TniB family NTP-binding protein [Pseudomonas sp. CVAP\